ncbi:hypothetical protein LWI29_011670 [Acer saccharum]|uniref:Uncharacterized protein n=1 Tax=Acer saccharum TaxID=4024 RepID=A0AA39W2B1_ACESA|nr:hypothetical protein LWI29_011670 [Acer saccharum]
MRDSSFYPTDSLQRYTLYNFKVLGSCILERSAAADIRIRILVDYVKFRDINNEKGKFEKVGFTVKDFAGVSGQI